MSRVPLFSEAGIPVGEATLEPAMFEVQVNVPVMHQVVVAQMNARRSGTHDTKTRGEVRGGGRKPYKQKGTGRARQGSIRAPHYAGGGVVWGPHPRSYVQKVPKKVRFLALRSALSDRAAEGRIAVIETLSFDEPKTKVAVQLLAAAGVTGKVLLVLDEIQENVWKSFRNLPEVHIVTTDQLNVYDIIAREWLVFSKAALEKVNGRAATIKPKGTATPTTAPGGDAA